MNEDVSVVQEADVSPGVETLPDGHGRCLFSSEICLLRRPKSINFPWPAELQYRKGSPQRLAGISIYYDFDWEFVFGHVQGQFRNSEPLARFVQKECPENSTPALLLTTRTDVAPRAIDWNDRFIVVVNIDEYRKLHAGNPAVDFFASHLTSRLTRIADIEEGDIAAWAGQIPERVTKLKQIVQRLDSASEPRRPANPDDVKKVFEALGKVDGELIDLTLDLFLKGGIEADFLLKKILETGEIDDFSVSLEWLLNAENRKIVEQLSRLEGTSLQKLNSLSTIAALQNVLAIWKCNRSNGDENFWQRTLEQNSFILGQIFSVPAILFQSKAYVGGKTIENQSGNIVDFLLKTVCTNNVAFVEIKTPTTELLTKSLYRGDVYNIDSEISGAVLQVANQREAFVKECDELKAKSERKFNAFSPKCVVIVGDTAQLSEEKQIKSFELLRSVLNGVEIITFDELFARVESLFNLFSQNPLVGSDNVSVPQ